MNSRSYKTEEHNNCPNQLLVIQPCHGLPLNVHKHHQTCLKFNQVRKIFFTVLFESLLNLIQKEMLYWKYLKPCNHNLHSVKSSKHPLGKYSIKFWRSGLRGFNPVCKSHHWKACNVYNFINFFPNTGTHTPLPPPPYSPPFSYFTSQTWRENLNHIFQNIFLFNTVIFHQLTKVHTSHVTDHELI